MKSWLAAAFVLITAVLPNIASAANDPDLTYPTGTLLSTGSKIRAHNVGNITLTTSEGTYTCSYGETTGTLTKNNGTEVEASLETGAFAGTGTEDKCTTSGSPLGEFTLKTNSATNGMPWCLRSTPAMKEDEAQIRGGACSGAAKALRLTLESIGPSTYCEYERTAAIKGTYSTHPEDLLLKTTEVETTLVKGTAGFACPTSTKVDLSMTVENESALAEPVYVSAGPKLTFPTGTSLATGGKLRATNVGGAKFTSSLGTLECTSDQWTGTLKKNTGTQIEADIETGSLNGTGAGSSCTTPEGDMRWTLSPLTNGLPWCFRATSTMASDEFQIRGGKCAEEPRPIRFVMESVKTEACEYERAATSPVSATYKTHPEDTRLEISEAEFTKAVGSIACPASLKLDSTYTFERDNTPEVAPLYIS